jgi:anti-repressor protein
MQEKGLQAFNFEGKQTRIVMIDGAPWWVAKDVCSILGLGDVNKATERLDEDEKLVRKIFVSGQNRDMITVNESGLYALIIRSNKPEAKKFRKWVTSEVLPVIRKHGAYMTKDTYEKIINNPIDANELVLNIAMALKQERAKTTALETKIEEVQPKLLLAESLIASHTSCSPGVFAKRLRQMGLPMGLKRLFKRLRKEDLLMRDKSIRRHIPTQRAMEMKLFEVTTTITNDGNIHTDVSTRITPKGQEYFVRKFLGESTASRQMVLPGI